MLKAKNKRQLSQLMEGMDESSVDPEDDWSVDFHLLSLYRSYRGPYNAGKLVPIKQNTYLKRPQTPQFWYANDCVQGKNRA